jgi:hypothetical protein
MILDLKKNQICFNTTICKFDFFSFFKTILIVGFISLIQPFLGQSHFKNIQIPKPITSTYPSSQVEPSIAINPKNTNEIAVGTVLDDYHFSKDGGLTWKSYTLTSKYGVNGDPVMLFDKKNRIYFFHLSNYSKGSYIDRIVCQSAKRIDKKFNKGTFPKPNGTKSQDKHWVAYNNQKHEIYMTWTQFDKYGSKNPNDSSVILFSKSSNSGKTWIDPIRISKKAGDCVDSNNTLEGAVPTVGLNGEIYVVWAGFKKLFFQKSLDGGKTWLQEEKEIATQDGGWDFSIPGLGRCNGFPILICDTNLQSPYKGRIYLNWADQRNGKNNTDVWLMYSDDGGETWSEHKKVNQDKKEAHQFFTWMALDQKSSSLYFVYYDRRNYTNNQTDVYLSVSKDGGSTFKDYKISESPFTPNDDVFFGDYNNIAVENGVIRPVWSRMDERQISLWIALIDSKDLN